MATISNNSSRDLSQQVIRLARHCAIAVSLPLGAAGFSGEARAQDETQPNAVAPGEDLSEFRFNDQNQIETEKKLDELEARIREEIAAEIAARAKEDAPSKEAAPKAGKVAPPSPEDWFRAGAFLVAVGSTIYLIRDLYKSACKYAIAKLSMPPLGRMWGDFREDVSVNGTMTHVQTKGSPRSYAELTPVQLYQSEELAKKMPFKLTAYSEFFGFAPTATVWSTGITLRPGNRGIKFSEVCRVTPTVQILDGEKLKTFFWHLDGKKLLTKPGLSDLVKVVVHDAESVLLENRLPQIDARENLRGWRSFAKYMAKQCKHLGLSENEEAFRNLAAASKTKTPYFRRFVAAKSSLASIRAFPFEATADLSETLDIIQEMHAFSSSSKVAPLTASLLKELLLVTDEVSTWQRETSKYSPMASDFDSKDSTSLAESNGGFFGQMDKLIPDVNIFADETSTTNDDFSPTERVRNIALGLIEMLQPEK